MLPVHHDSALETAKLLKDWCTLFATISVAAIGSTGLLSAATSSEQLCSPRVLAVLSVVAFLVASSCAALLLLAIPALVSRLKRGGVSKLNDVYELEAFLFLRNGKRLARIGFIAAL